MLYKDKAKRRFSGTGAGTTAGVTVTESAPSNGNHRHVCTNIQASGDAAALVTVESPANTILYRKRFAGAFTLSENFDVGLWGAAGAAILVKVSASTANSEANIQGVTV